MGQFYLINDFEPNDISIIDHKERIDSPEFLIFQRNHLLNFCDLLLILMNNCRQFVCCWCKFVLQLYICWLLSSQSILHLVNNLIAALKLLQCILMRKFFSANLFAEELNLTYVFLVLFTGWLHLLMNKYTNEYVILIIIRIE